MNNSVLYENSAFNIIISVIINMRYFERTGFFGDIYFRS